MSTPLYGELYQETLSHFTYEHRNTWPDGTCTLAARVNGGDTGYVAIADNNDELYLYTPDLANIGSHTVVVEIYYIQWAESLAGPTQVFDSGSIIVTIEPLCMIETFENNPVVSSTLEMTY